MTQGTATFDEALEWLLANEGGWVNNPNDHGGPTAYGVTQQAWEDFTGKPCSPEDIKGLTQQDVRRFYDGVYWLPLGLAAWDRAIAIAVFDMAVLNGAGVAIRLAQRAMGVIEDGIPGVRTRDAASPGRMPLTFLLRFVPLMAVRFARIVKHDPTKLEFLEAWIVRAMRLLTLCNNT